MRKAGDIKVENAARVCVSDYPPDAFVKSPTVAGLLNITDQRLRSSRTNVPAWPGPPFRRIRGGGVLYLWSEVLDWLDEQRVDPAERRVESAT